MSKKDDSEPGRRNFLRTAASVAAASIPATSYGESLGRDYTTAERSPEIFPGTILDVTRIRVGHFTDRRRPTGCTAVIFEGGAVAGVDVRGSAPGTRETDLLNPVNTVQKVNAIVLSGGSAFGLDAASGAMRYLSDHREGFRVGSALVPIVPAAILFDLELGDPHIYPDAEAGYAACQAASSSGVQQGNVGAGAGATVGKLFGMEFAMKSGLGTASLGIGSSDIFVASIVAVNAVGDVRSWHRGALLAGARTQDGTGLRNCMKEILAGVTLDHKFYKERPGMNTTVGVVATNAVLNKTEANKVAQMAHDGLARTIWPVHTAMDGDTIFAAANGTASVRADVTTIGSVAAEAVARAVNNAVLTAIGIPGFPAYNDFPRH